MIQLEGTVVFQGKYPGVFFHRLLHWRLINQDRYIYIYYVIYATQRSRDGLKKMHMIQQSIKIRGPRIDDGLFKGTLQE